MGEIHDISRNILESLYFENRNLYLYIVILRKMIYGLFLKSNKSMEVHYKSILNRIGSYLLLPTLELSYDVCIWLIDYDLLI